MGNQHSGAEGEREVHEGSGYRVFNLYHGSPAYESGLEVYFDYIVALKEQPVDGRQTSRDRFPLRDGEEVGKRGIRR